MKKKIPDPLKTPIDTAPILDLALKSWSKKGHKPGLYQEMIDKEIDTKIPYLRVALNLHPNATDREILVAFAKQKYPGFCMDYEAPRRGAKQKWSEIILSRLYFEVQNKIIFSNKKLSITSALDDLLYFPFWKAMLNLKADPVGDQRETVLERFIRQYYHAEKLQLVQMYEGLDFKEKASFVKAILEDLVNVSSPQSMK